LELIRSAGRKAGSTTGPGFSPAVMVIIFPDGGDRYLSESFWETGN
jgi:cysteine synthase